MAYRLGIPRLYFFTMSGSFACPRLLFKHWSLMNWIQVILSQKEILKALKQKIISITPFDPSAVGPVSVYLRLGNYFRRLKKLKKPLAIGREFSFSKALAPEVFVKTGGSLYLKPQEMVLGMTLERIRLAAGVAARIEGRSSVARTGLSVHVSSSLVKPGSDNVQVLEIINNSPSTLAVVPGTRICQLVFEEVRGKSLYQGAFKYQTRP